MLLAASIYLNLSSGDFDRLLPNIPRIPDGESQFLPAEKGLGGGAGLIDSNLDVRQQPALAEKAVGNVTYCVQRSTASRLAESLQSSVQHSDNSATSFCPPRRKARQLK